jgi:hypothetical protein
MTRELTNFEIAAANPTPGSILTATYELLVAQVKGFRTYRRTPMLTILPADLPALAVYLLRDREAPIGDSNTGEPKFNHFAHFGISAAILTSDMDTQLELVEAKVHAARQVLYTTPKWIALTAGIESTDGKLVFWRQGESPITEYEMEMVVRFETVWPPDVRDDYLTLHLETAFPNVDERSKVQQVKRTWDIDQNT